VLEISLLNVYDSVADEGVTLLFSRGVPKKRHRVGWFSHGLASETWINSIVHTYLQIYGYHVSIMQLGDVQNRQVVLTFTSTLTFIMLLLRDI
jgi:hypothetical protein